MSNFILHETITFDDRDPPWINSQVKYLNNENRYCVRNTKYISKITKAVSLLQCFSQFRIN